MLLSEYIDETTNPFCNTTVADDNVRNSDFQTLLTSYMDLYFGDLSLRKRLTNATLFKSACETIYDSNKYKYDKLFATLSLEYNPIENYNMVEQGSDDRTINGGQRSNGKTSSSSLGAQTIGDTGSVSTGAQTNSSTKQISPFNSNGYTNAEKVDETYGARSDSNSNTRSVGARSDSASETETLGAYTDRDVLTHEFTRSGNIGITTSQAMIEQDRQVAKFNIVKVVAKDIVAGCLNMVY